MNKITICLLLCAFPAFIFSQKDYFQQEVNCKINVVLDDDAHTLTGEISMEYINHSPDALEQIYIHLWANAYKNRKSAFAKQQLETGSTTFYFSEPRWRGNFSDLAFKVDGETAAFTIDAKQPDIGLLQLNKPLAPGASMTIHTPFILKIPGSFSRLGHVGESYQMTQWFPKPAVYDNEGWHPMPYLDMGEFYSEFGDYEVKITLPENYVVAASGEIQEASEKAFLQQKIEETDLLMNSTFPTVDTFPTSSTTMKTITYKADDVHDFAWFADKRFHVQKSAVKMASGRTVDSWAFFTNVEAEMWKKGTFYVDRALEFYSKHVGEYPYPQATAVQSALSAGGGMEYPMITVIGLSGDPQSLDAVITHEVGHNWFYGILAFDEREHAWMDEGLNSYYDHRYMKQYYEEEMEMVMPKFMMKGSDLTELEVAYLFQARRNLDQPPATSSADFERINYFLGAYEKPARIFRMLEMYLGTAENDRLMKGFYEKWKFKHPKPTDLRNYLETNGQRDLGWLFDGLIGSIGKIDYALTGIQKGEQMQVEVSNKGDLKTPFSLSGMRGEEIVETRWFEGFEGKKSVNFPSGDYDRVVLDAKHDILDINRQNNNIRTSGMLKTVEPLRLKFLGGVEHSQRTTLYWSPLLAYNDYDKGMLGLALYNSLIPARKFEFSLAPLYSFETSDLNGIANVRYNIFPKSSSIRRLTFGLSAKSFNRAYIERDDYHLKYRRLVPSVNLQFGSKPGGSTAQSIEARAILLDNEFAVRDTDGVYLNNDFNNTVILSLKYTLNNKRALNPFKLQVGLEQQNYDNIKGEQHYLKAWLDWQSAYTYARGRNIDFRIYIGAFLDNTARKAGAVSNDLARGSFSLISQGFTDYQYDGLYLGRNEVVGIWSQQITQEQGGLKTAFGSSHGIGQSNNFILALNMKADLPQDLPLNLPLKPYFDIGYFDNAQPIASGATLSDQLLWSGGIMLDLIDESLAIYFPLVNSKNIKTLYQGRGDYSTRISWTLDLNRLDPWKFVDQIKF